MGTLALLGSVVDLQSIECVRVPEPMGDFLFAPLYSYLCEREVKFKFFHRLDALRVYPKTKAKLKKLSLAARSNLKTYLPAYKPLIDVPGRAFKSWPIHQTGSIFYRGQICRATI